MACTQTLSVGADIAAAAASAANGAEICLNAGSYGVVTIEDVHRTGFVTIRAVEGATVTMTPVIENCSYIRLQDVRCNGAQLLDNDSHHLEYINCTWVPNGEGIAINGLNDTPPATPQEIVFDGCTLVDTTIALWDGRFNIRGMNGVKVRNCLFGGSNNASEKSDGIMIIGGSINTEIGPGNTFEEFHQETAEQGEHIDCIQFVGAGTGTRIFGNYFRDSDVFMGAFDGVTGVTVEHNVFDATARASRTEFQGVRNLAYRHNTWRGTMGAPLIDTPKVGDQSNQNNVVENNVFADGAVPVVQSCSGCTIDSNVFETGAGIGTNRILGAPTFAGGANPTTYAGHALAPGSVGVGAGNDDADAGIIAAPDPGTGTPVITGLSGSSAHNGTLTITGTGFGSKNPVAPVMWDNGSGPDDIRDIWTDGWPKGCLNPIFNIRRRDTGWRGVATPHTRTNRYMTGAHGEGFTGGVFDGTKGANIILLKNFAANPSVSPLHLYVSYWFRVNPDWTFGLDNNFKHMCYGYLPQDFTTRQIIAIYQAPQFNTSTATPKWQVAAQENPQHPGFLMQAEDKQFFHNGFVASPNPTQDWIKVEYIAVMGADGFIQLYNNGVRVLNYTGRTDVHPSQGRRVQIGHFGRPYQDPDRWRFFTDCYIDSTHARVVFGNASTLSACTIREMQLPQAWADTGVQVKVNRGVFTNTDTVYVFVVNGVNEASAGFPVAAGGAVPVITSPLTVTGEVGQTCTYQIVASGATSFAAPGRPAGVTFNTSTGQMGGTYQTAGHTETQIGATNASGTDTRTLVFDITWPEDKAPAAPGPITVVRGRASYRL